MNLRPNFRVSIQSSAGLVRWFNPAALDGADWYADRYGGFSAGNITVKSQVKSIDPALAGPYDIHQDDLIEFYYKDENYARYRGKIRRTNSSSGKPGKTTYQLIGIGGDLGDTIVKQRYAWASADISTAFSAIATDALVRGPSPELRIDVKPIGITIDEDDHFLETVKSTFDDLVNQTANTSTWGSYIDESLVSRPSVLRFGPIGDVSKPKYAITIPQEKISANQNDIAPEEVYNRVILIGGDPKYPQLVFNSGLERPKRAGGGLGNILLNGDFEDGETGWSFENGASRKEAGAGEGSAYSGSAFGEVDSGDEIIRQTQNPSPTAIVEGNSYYLAMRLRRENGTTDINPPSTYYYFAWLDEDDNVLQSYSRRLQVNTAIWQIDNETTSPTTNFFETVTPPANTTGFEFYLHGEDGLDDSLGESIHLDYVELYDVNSFRQEGWDLEPFNGVQIVSQNWMYPDTQDKSGYALQLAINATEHPYKLGWITGVSYSVDDIITYDGANYIAVQDHTSSLSNSPRTDDAGAYWQTYGHSNESLVTYNRGNWSNAGVLYNLGDVVVALGPTYDNTGHENGTGSFMWYCEVAHTSTNLKCPSCATGDWSLLTSDISEGTSEPIDGAKGVRVIPYGKSRFQIVGGQSLDISVAIKQPYGWVDGQMEVWLNFQAFNQEGTTVTNHEEKVAFFDTGYQRYGTTVNTPIDAAYGLFYLTVKGTGTIVFDGFSVRDSQASTEAGIPWAYIPDGPLRIGPIASKDVFGAEDTVPGWQEDATDPENPLYAVWNSENTYGIRERKIEQDSIKNDRDAYLFIANLLKQNAFVVPASSITINDPPFFLPGEVVRLIGRDGLAMAAAPLPVARVHYVYSNGMLSAEVDISREKRDSASVILQMIDKRLKMQGQISSAGSVSQPNGLGGGSWSGDSSGEVVEARSEPATASWVANVYTSLKSRLDAMGTRISNALVSITSILGFTISAGTGLTGGGDIGDGSVTISLANTSVTPGSYTNMNATVNAQGQITSASNGISGSDSCSWDVLTTGDPSGEIVFADGNVVMIKDCS